MLALAIRSLDADELADTSCARPRCSSSSGGCSKDARQSPLETCRSGLRDLPS